VKTSDPELITGKLIVTVVDMDGLYTSEPESITGKLINSSRS